MEIYKINLFEIAPKEYKPSELPNIQRVPFLYRIGLPQWENSLYFCIVRGEGERTVIFNGSGGTCHLMSSPNTRSTSDVLENWLNFRHYRDFASILFFFAHELIGQNILVIKRQSTIFQEVETMFQVLPVP